MKAAETFRSGKTHRNENFPVASRLIEARYRAPVLAFYQFVRVADDVADHPSLPASARLELLDTMEADLLGRGDVNIQATALRDVLDERGLSPQHALDLLQAFRLDVTKSRYADWRELMQYCELSAMPVGRFVLDVHGESRVTWPQSDALCAALQIINHLQDCSADFRINDRVYLPASALAAHGVELRDLAGNSSSPALRRCITDLALRTEALLHEGRALAGAVSNPRLGAEIAVIIALANRLVRRLCERDPLCDEMHLLRGHAAAIGMFAAIGHFIRHFRRPSDDAISAQRP